MSKVLPKLLQVRFHIFIIFNVILKKNLNIYTPPNMTEKAESKNILYFKFNKQGEYVLYF